jgi:hypothetical protein
LAGALSVALAAGLAGCITLFSPCPSSATGSRGLLLCRRWRGCSDLLLEQELTADLLYRGSLSSI